MYTADKKRERILILGAAGRDFHNFNVFFRSRPQFEVVGFTAAQIPDIACRLYPPELSGGLYPAGLPIWPEDALEEIINKANSAAEEDIITIQANASRLNPKAGVVVAGSEVTAEDHKAISGKRVLIVEDGPTITHGEMAYGAGQVAARRYNAAEIIDPRPYVVGSLKEIFSKFRHIGRVLPAMGYYPQQIRELEETINKAECDSVIIASPIDLRRLIQINKPSTYVLYDLVDMDRPYLREKIEEFISKSISKSLNSRENSSGICPSGQAAHEPGRGDGACSWQRPSGRHDTAAD